MVPTARERKIKAGKRHSRCNTADVGEPRKGNLTVCKSSKLEFELEDF